MRNHTASVGLLPLAAALILQIACGASTAPTTPPGPTVSLAANAAGDVGTTRNFVGQSLKLSGAGFFADLRFSWERWDGLPPYTHAPTAFGTLYLLDREYLGPPNSLSTSTPGFVARSQSTSASDYVFAADVVIWPDRTYWFYSDTRGDFLTSSEKNVYDGGNMYVSGIDTLAFKLSGDFMVFVSPFVPQVPNPLDKYPDANFRLQGTIR